MKARTLRNGNARSLNSVRELVLDASSNVRADIVGNSVETGATKARWTSFDAHGAGNTIAGDSGVVGSK